MTLNERSFRGRPKMTSFSKGGGMKLKLLLKTQQNQTKSYCFLLCRHENRGGWEGHKLTFDEIQNDVIFGRPLKENNLCNFLCVYQFLFLLVFSDIPSWSSFSWLHQPWAMACFSIVMLANLCKQRQNNRIITQQQT